MAYGRVEFCLSLLMVRVENILKYSLIRLWTRLLAIIFRISVGRIFGKDDTS